jgi:hypothetical protein
MLVDDGCFGLGGGSIGWMRRLGGCTVDGIVEEG